MTTYVLLAIAALVVLAIVAALVWPKALPPGPTTSRLAEGSKPAKTGPTLQDKLDARKAEMTEPASPGAVAAAPVPIESVSISDVQLVPPPAPGRAKAAVPAHDNVGDLRRGLARARGDEGFFGRIAQLVRGRSEMDPALVDSIEDVLVSSDVGVKGAQRILGRLREGLARDALRDPAAVWGALRSEARAILAVPGGGPLGVGTRPTVVMMVGVNGAGKTTTIGKIATKLRAEGKQVVLAAGDTFRAAAVQQLEEWGKRSGCEVITGKDGGDPAAVAFEAVQRAKATGADVVLVDTAGRLQTKAPLMDELRKIAKTLGKAQEGAPHETWLVLDATTGQNALSQARQFGETLPLTGVVLTKLDGTAKGGIVLSISEEMRVPVRYIGLGERADDLHPFVADEFVEALFGEAGRAADAA